MKTTMDELFMELNKDNTPISASIPGADLSQLEKMMDKKLTDLMDKIEKDKTPHEPQEGTEKPLEEVKDTNANKEPEKAAEEATGGGEEATE